MCLRLPEYKADNLLTPLLPMAPGLSSINILSGQHDEENPEPGVWRLPASLLDRTSSFQYFIFSVIILWFGFF